MKENYIFIYPRNSSYYAVNYCIVWVCFIYMHYESVHCLSGEAAKEKIETGNETLSTDFILLGLYPVMTHTGLLVLVVLLIYTIAITGNTTLILLIWVDPHLHTSKYFLLRQLSLIDLDFIYNIVPKMLVNFFSGKRDFPDWLWDPDLLHFYYGDC